MECLISCRTISFLLWFFYFLRIMYMWIKHKKPATTYGMSNFVLVCYLSSGNINSTVVIPEWVNPCLLLNLKYKFPGCIKELCLNVPWNYTPDETRVVPCCSCSQFGSFQKHSLHPLPSQLIKCIATSTASPCR